MFRNRLLKTALHLDFLRLRCGSEKRFHQGTRTVERREAVAAHVFATLSEWDAVVVLPCDSLYPDVLTSLYANDDVASSISGNAGYFAYLWEHEINVSAREDIGKKLGRMATDGITTIISLRFDDRIRRELGLAAELLFCDYLHEQLHPEGIDAIVAHTLGWNDVVVLAHTTEREDRLLTLLSKLRLLTLEQCLGSRMELVPHLAEVASSPVFAASYSHLACSYRRFIAGSMALGALAGQIVSATVLVRAIPSLESELRTKMFEITRDAGAPVPIEEMPSEMGHYSFSVNATELARSSHGGDLLKLILDVRRHIGSTTGEGSESYAETSTRLRFVEPVPVAAGIHRAVADTELRSDIERVRELLKEIPRSLAGKGVSAMTAHRFNSVLVTLLDNLADPVRSSVVRHLTRFMMSTPGLIAQLERAEIDDLCHVCEYAVIQATDGIAQFQHDAAALGLTGRGGYSRLIAAMETYMRDLFSVLGIKEIVPLLTFGLRTGGRGSTGRFQTDVSFNTVFVPSSWYVLVHEAGHTAWVSSFGWLGESLATYEALEREINITMKRKGVPPEQTLIEVIRTRAIVRELFANYLVYRVTCGSDLAAFDRLSLRHILASRSGGGTREVLIAVVLHCLLKMADQNSGARDDWWSGWDRRRHEDHTELVQDAIDSINAAMKAYIEDSTERTSGRDHRGRRREHAQRNLMIVKQRLMKADMFHEVAASALQSVLNVLALSSVEFGGKSRTAHAAQFAEFQRRLDAASRHLAAYDEWRSGFGDWLSSGEVLALAPPGWVWSKLLLESRDFIRDRQPSAFLVSQLGVILSLWHRAVTQRVKEPSSWHLTSVLRPLDLVESKAMPEPE